MGWFTTGRITVLFALLIAGAPIALAQPADAPWRKFAPGGDAVGTLQRAATKRPPGSLCQGRAVTTQSPLDKVQLPTSAQAQLTPPLAQGAGFVAMVDASQRDAIRNLVISRLQAHQQWSQAAEEGYFEYLLHEAGVARDKAQATFGIIGSVTGGLTGMLGGRMMDDVTGSYGMGGQGVIGGSQSGARGAQALRPTEFLLSQDEVTITTVVDALLAKPCDISATDAIVSLKLH